MPRKYQMIKRRARLVGFEAYAVQRRSAIKRGIKFDLTFTEWWSIWQQSGYWYHRGCCRGQYVMARFGDKGPYAISNVAIVLVSQNAIEGNRNRTGMKYRKS